MNENGYQLGRLFEHLPTSIENEEFLSLVSSGTTRIERIVSSGQSSPAGFWYDQDEEEFVLLVAGGAILSIEGHDKKVELKSGDWIKLPVHCRHRVEWTSADPVTVWLAVFTKP
jgi:cupin 2 domain-containing protein